MSFSSVLPAPALRHAIARYWALRAEFARPERIVLLPDAGIHMLVVRGAGVRSRRFDTTLEAGRLHLVGAMLRSDEQILLGEQALVGVTFRPGGFPCFYEWAAMREVADRVVPFERALALDAWRPLAELAPQLDRHFLERLRPPTSNVLQVVADIEACAGDVRVDALTKRHGTTGRTLERHFVREVGITPKELAAITRLRRALTVIERDRGRRSLMEIAWDCGYYDHAHLTRELERFLGERPSRVALSDLSKMAAG